MDAYEPRTEPKHFTVPPKWIPFPTKIAYRLFEAKKIFESFEENTSGVSIMVRVLTIYLGADALAVKTCTEIEGEWMKLLGEIHDIPVIPVGLLPPSTQEIGDSTWGTIGN